MIKLSGLAPDEMPIVYTGIRAGEKLEEALWEAGAITESTRHPDVVKVIETTTARLSPEFLRTLVLATEQSDVLRIRAMLLHLIPTVAPSLEEHGAAMRSDGST